MARAVRALRREGGKHLADYRLVHKRGSHGERIVGLSHLEFRVWMQYVLSADDYGVMRASSSVLRADNPKLEQEPQRKIDQSMRAIVASGLVAIFAHQGVSYWWQTNWQDFQQIRYPRSSVNPAPSQQLLATATAATRKLFGMRDKAPKEVFGNVSEIDPVPAGAGGPETLTLTQTLTPTQTLPKGEESAREGVTVPAENGDSPTVLDARVPPRWAAPLINGAEQRRHGQHSFCGRVCVMFGQHMEFIRKLGTGDAETRLKAWYPTVMAKYENRPIGDLTFEFWDNEFSAWVGTVTSKPAPVAVGKGEQTRQSMQRVLARRAEKLS